MDLHGALLNTRNNLLSLTVSFFLMLTSSTAGLTYFIFLVLSSCSFWFSETLIVPMCSIEYSIRLALLSRCSGRVEVYHNSMWKTLCDDWDWGIPNARVACREVGCGSPLNTSNWNHTGNKTGQIWLRVGCSGHEGSLEECLKIGSGFNNCSHTQEAAVTCSGERDNAHIKIQTSEINLI